MANAMVSRESILDFLYYYIKKEFDRVEEIRSEKGIRWTKPDSVRFTVVDPFIFSPLGMLPQQLGEFKLEQISFEQYRATRSNYGTGTRRN